MTPAPTTLRIAVSACLLGEPVRYDGQEKTCAAVRDGLAALAELVPLCPEVGAGMPVPREPVDLHGDAAAPRMIGGVTGEDWTERTLAWIEAALDRCESLGVSGFVLKARSPSCGVGTAALYAVPGAGPARTDGLLAAAIRRRFPHLPLVEDEGLDAAAFVLRLQRLTR
ncbi:MAG: DUF523 domain-containing protein [bacterium]|jgi:uncharacterized protein YbbK (DUF523 family)|nr:DUF523 domain-containing protein [bacterium]